MSAVVFVALSVMVTIVDANLGSERVRMKERNYCLHLEDSLHQICYLNPCLKVELSHGETTYLIVP